MLLTTKRKGPNTFHRRLRGICRVHSFRNKIAFYEAVPFLFHLSSGFAENNLNFMQQQLRGTGASFHPQTGLAMESCFCLLAAPASGDFVRGAQRASGGPELGAVPAPATSEGHGDLSGSLSLACQHQPPEGLVSPKCISPWIDPIFSSTF